MIKGLGQRLACRGKIKIGGLGEVRKSQGGKEYRLPVKYDHFVITSNTRTKAGDLETDKEIMEVIGDKTEIDVVLFGNSIEDVYDDWYAFYDGKKAICRGNGDTAVWKGDKQVFGKLYGQLQAIDADTVVCRGDQCPLFKKEEDKTGCKLNFILRVMLIDAPAIGGVYELRSTSINSALAMRASISMLANVTSGQITGVPLKLKLSPKTVQLMAGQSTIYVTHLEYPGSFLDLKRAAIEQQKQVLMLDHSLVDARKYQDYEDDNPEEMAAVVQEFMPVEPEPEKPKTSRLEAIVLPQVQHGEDVVNTLNSATTGEVLPQPVSVQPSEPKNFEFMKIMQGYKKDLGDEAYYGILKAFGFSHCDEIHDRKTQLLTYEEMKRYTAALEELKASGDIPI